MASNRSDRPGARGAGIRGTAAALLILLAGLTLMAAGCGDDSSDTSANEDYANSVCTAIGGWEQQVTSIATNLSGGLSKASLQAAIGQAESATTTLVSEIKAVPAPDTSEGQAAKQQVDQLSADVTTTVNSAKSTVAEIPSDASAATIGAALAGLAPQVKSLASTAQTTVTSLKDAGGSLASAFKSADSCQSLGG